MNLISKQDIIDTNEMIIDDWNLNHSLADQQYFCFDNSRLDEVLKIVEDVKNIPDTYEVSNLMRKVSYLMGAISWAQPFCDGNKRTGLLIAATILDENHIQFEPYDEDKIIDLLYEIQEERVELNKETMDKIILYISKSVK